MSKELFIASSPHETKVAVLDDDQLVEVYFERDTDVGLVGGIYKGRVNRVLPGMQSAFVDIGLERDAFLYVSDFLEDAEEYDKIVADAEARVNRYTEKGQQQESPRPAPAEALVAEHRVQEALEEPAAEAVPERPDSSAMPSQEAAAEAGIETAPPASVPMVDAPKPPDRPFQESKGEFRRNDHRGGRRRGRRGPRFGDRKFSPKPESRERPAESPRPPEPAAPQSFEILPGESLAKYSHSANEPVGQEVTEPVVTEAPPTESFDPSPAMTTEAIPFEEAVHREAFRPALQAEMKAPLMTAPESIETEDVTPLPAPAAPAAPPPGDDRPRPLWNRLVSTVFGENSRAEEKTREQAIETQVSAETVSQYEPEVLEADETPLESGMESNALPEEDASSEGQEEQSEQMESSEAQEPTAVNGSSEQTGASDATSEPAEKTYTLREPHQRPRFAPRRRRGRRGRGQRDFRPSGGPPPRQSARPGNHQPVQISELLKEGQEILVQIAKEPLGRKGARITSHIALPGRYLVYMPTVDHIGVSRKIASEEERLRLRNIILETKGAYPGGFIVRTAGAGQPDDELKADMKFLLKLWSDIRAKAESTKAPALLHADLNLVQRILRDLLSPDFKTVWLDSEIEYARTVEFVNRCQPSLVNHVKLFTRNASMFEEFGVHAEIEKALKPKVWLKSGGYIVINQTEALVAIDVNTGKYVGKTNRLEDTIVKTNIDAVNEIVRQIRMRDLGGIIVIDFIDMDERRNRNKVVQALEEALRKDRAPTKILSFNDFGLVAITRKRVKQSLERTLCEPCSYCSGAGWVKSVTTVCNEILVEARKMAPQLEGDVVTLRVNSEVAHALKSREGLVLSELESILRKNVVVKSDPSVHQERFEIY
jgi:ribonuclease G